MNDVTLRHWPNLSNYAGHMSEEQRREFGRDGVSGLVDRDRALRAKLLPRRTEPPRQPAAPITVDERLADKR